MGVEVQLSEYLLECMGAVAVLCEELYEFLLHLFLAEALASFLSFCHSGMCFSACRRATCQCGWRTRVWVSVRVVRGMVRGAAVMVAKLVFFLDTATRMRLFCDAWRQKCHGSVMRRCSSRHRGGTALRFGPYRGMERPETRCKTAHFGARNGPFCNTLCANALRWMTDCAARRGVTCHAAWRIVPRCSVVQQHGYGFQAHVVLREVHVAGVAVARAP